MSTISSHSSRDNQAHTTLRRRHDWRRLPIQVLCVLLLLQGSPLFALQEGWLTARPEIPEWLPGMPTAAEISIPSPDWRGAWQRSRWELEILGTTLWSVASQDGSGGGSSEKPTKLPTMPKTKVEPPDIPPFDPSTLESVSPPLEAITLVPGWNFVSIPEQPDDTSAASVLAPIEGKYFKVWAVDNCDTEDPWKLYQPSDLASSDLETIDPTKGMWIKALEVVDLPSTGTMAQKTSIHLCPGWNLIGFPLPQIRTLPEAMRPFEGKYRRIMSYDATATRSQWDVYSTDVPEWGNDLWEMKPGRAYWVLATEEVTAEFINEGPPPEVELFTPDDLTVVTEPIEVLGAVRSPFLDHWTLRYRPAGEEEWTNWATGDRTTDVYNLAEFDPTLLLNGLYEIQLTAVDWAGQTAESEIRSVSVEGNMKIGNFTLSFVDLSVPVSGLDLEIIRTYDSRDKLKRDFGVGWSLDIRQGSYRNNRAPGDGWQLAEGFLPCDSAIESKAHVTTIRLSDREIYRFALRLVDGLSSTGGGCYAHAEFEYVDGPIPGATLEILGNIRVFQETRSSDRVLDLDTLQTFEPQNVRLTTRDKRIFDLDLDIGVTRVEDPNGNQIEIRKEGIFHSTGKSISFARDAEDRIIYITDPMGFSTSYIYSTLGDLVAVTDPENVTARYQYENHYLTSFTAPDGRRPLRNEYDAMGRLTRHVDVFGNAISYKHKLSARQEIITDRLGHSQLVEYDKRGNAIREVDRTGSETLRTIGAYGNILSEQNALGDTVLYTYDSIGQKITETDPLGNKTSYTYDSDGHLLTLSDQSGIVSLNTYDSSGNLLSTTDPAGNTVAYSYDTKGQMERILYPDGAESIFRYDTSGNIVKETDELGREKHHTHDANGNRLSTTQFRARADGTVETITQEFEYDRRGRPTQITNATANTTSITYDPQGNQLTTVNRRGQTVHYEYDPLGRRTRTTFPDGTSETWTYDPEGRVVKQTDRAAQTISYQYDAEGRVIEAETAEGKVATVYDAVGRVTSLTKERSGTTLYEYDSAGHVLKQIDPLGQAVCFRYNSRGNRISRTDPKGQATLYEYDARGLVTRIVNPEGNTQSIRTYDERGRILSETDPQGEARNFEYDAAGQLVKVKDALGHATLYTYDELGNVSSVTNPAGRKEFFEYDKVSRLIRQTDPDGRLRTMSYNAAGDLASIASQSGAITSFSYDNAGRMVRRNYPDGTFEAFTYRPTGQRTSATGELGKILYEYDALDRLSAVIQPDGRRLSYSYDSESNQVQMIASLGDIQLPVDRSFDAASRLATVSGPTGRLFHFGYDENGNRQSLAYPNGIETRYAYNTTDQLVSLSALKSNKDIVWSYLYQLGPSGNLLSVEENDGTVRKYTYDSLYRLTGEALQVDGTIDWNREYAYDISGNRIFETRNIGGASVQIQSTFDSRDRLVKRDGIAYTWDPEGRMVGTSDPDGATYTWDWSDRLTHITLSDGTNIRHFYDPDGNRVRSTVTPASGEPESVNYLLDVSSDLAYRVAETTDSGDLIAFYVWGDGGELLSVNRPSGVRFFHADGQGSIRNLSNDGGEVTDTYAFTAFGELLRHTGDDTNPFLYSGLLYDAASGLYDHRARWRNPETGLFLSADPFGGLLEDPQTLHRYNYVSNNPINDSDPSGEISAVAMNTIVSVIGRAMLTGIMYGAIFGGIEGILNDEVTITEGVLGGAFWGALLGPLGKVRKLQKFLFYMGTLLAGFGTYDAFVDGDTDLALYRGVLFVAGPVGGMVSGSRIDTGPTAIYQARPRTTTDKFRTVYVGITEQALKKREYQHNRGANGKNIELRKIRSLENLSKNDARSVEQALIELYGLGKNDGRLLNKINSVSPDKTDYANSLRRGYDLLLQAGWPFFRGF